MSQWQPQDYDPRQQQPATPPQWQQPRPGDPRYLPAPYQPPQYLPQPYGYPPYPPQVAPKSTGLAVLLGLVVPGLGAMYAGKAGLGVLVLVVWLISIPLILLAGIGFLTGLAAWIMSGVLGYTSAQNWNREHGIIS